MTNGIQYAFLLMASTLVVYFTGLKMSKLKEKKQRKKYLILSLVFNLGILFVFKYLVFFNKFLNTILSNFSLPNTPIFNLLLPVGISFYTFQILSYSIQVYRGEIKSEKHFGIFALYAAFFPTILSGPIEKANHLLPQLYKKYDFNYGRVVTGLKIVLFGLFLKLVIANRMSILVNAVYDNVLNFTGIPLIIATIFFAFQIYSDFAGYSFIALGVALILGFNLINNFQRPYFSKSIPEFWGRWHISLSNWFKDYLYIPLGGNRVKKSRWFFNILIVFLIVGLWHGASWTFIIWGGLNGGYLILSALTLGIREKITEKIGLTKFPKIHLIIKIIIAFVLICVSWIFFRANSFSDAIYILTHLFTNLNLNFFGPSLGLDKKWLLILFFAVGFMFFVEYIQETKGINNYLSKKPAWIRWVIYLLVTLSILIFGAFDNKPFIYFQF